MNLFEKITSPPFLTLILIQYAMQPEFFIYFLSVLHKSLLISIYEKHRGFNAKM